jgi:hypothetical protein
MQRLREIERRLDALVRQTQLGSAEGGLGVDRVFMKEFRARMEDVKRLAASYQWDWITPSAASRLPNRGVVLRNAKNMDAYVWFDDSAGGWLKASVNEQRDRPVNLDTSERVSDVSALESFLQQQRFMC